MLIMNWKEFLKPTKWKIALFCLILVLLFTFDFFLYGSIGGWTESHYYFLIPYPLAFGIHSITLQQTITYCAPSVIGCVPGTFYKIDYFGFGFNLLFWYLISCLIVLGYHKVKKK